MNARDLRIGNIVFDKSRSEHDFEKLGNGIYRVSSHAIERFDAGFMDLKPVHLTSEWLERFGAEVSLNCLYHLTKGHPIGFFDKENRFAYITLDIDVKYVHQLQNIHFALTGSELQLKDKTV